MNCIDIQLDLPLFQDNVLETAKTDSIREHLTACPLCRQKLADLQSIRIELRSLSRPAVSPAAMDSLRAAIVAEAPTFVNKKGRILSAKSFELLQMRLMPLGVGVLGSVVIGIAMLWLVLSANIRPIGPAASYYPGSETIMFHQPGDPLNADLDAADYARARHDVAGESPSVNPDGALVALTRALVGVDMKDDEVVVVADVYSNGLAQITEVVEPASNRKAIKELEKALETDPAYAPFVPASIDQRSGTIRVVFKIQTVDVDVRDDNSGRVL